jgi:hypothetical protein
VRSLVRFQLAPHSHPAESAADLGIRLSVGLTTLTAVDRGWPLHALIRGTSAGPSVDDLPSEIRETGTLSRTHPHGRLGKCLERHVGSHLLIALLVVRRLASARS